MISAAVSLDQSRSYSISHLRRVAGARNANGLEWLGRGASVQLEISSFEHMCDEW